ncbi:MAG: zinc-binding dehydrogenase [Prevotella sp.]|jgi:2-desacetyl-2-hydroxyethyl bacteriochlorophyllide A dehydrogenase|nr:zinc-binding dehydrogenase [Prevotella sp.]
MKTKRAVLVEPKKFEIRELEISPKPQEVLVKIASCGLCNWELNHWKGSLGRYPQSLGHEWAGTVVDVGEAVNNIKYGDNVTMIPSGPDKLEGFSQYATIPAINCAKLSPDINPKYAFAEPLKCIVTVLRAAKPETGDNGVILGCGPMGLWCVQALTGHFFNTLIAIDVDERKLHMAKKYGATHTINPLREDAGQKLCEYTDGYMADFVIEGTGLPKILNTGLTYLRKSGRGRLIMMSSHEGKCDEFDFREAMTRSAQIIVAHSQFSISEHDDLRRAASLINKGIFNIRGLVSHEFTLGNIEDAFETLEHKPEDYLKGIVVPN